MNENELLARVDESTKIAHKRIDRLEETTKDIRDLTYGVKEIANEMKHMRADVNKLDERVASIEKEPTAEYKDTKKQIRNTIISGLIGTLLGAFISLILK